MRPNINKDKIPFQFLVLILLISLLVILAGVMLYTSQKKKIITEKQNELAAISSLKVAEITKWRMEHMRDGRIISKIVPRNNLAFSFLNDNEQPELRRELLQRMEAFIEDYDYHSILLLDAAGRIRLAFPPVDSPIDQIILPVLNDSSDSEISLSKLHFSDDLPGLIHIDVQIPLFSSDNSRLGAILMRIDPGKLLFPMIQSWPTPSKSSETLLIRAEGDSILYMNELRHRKNTALKLKFPLNEKDLPASKAVSGYAGVFEGTDYRGIAVVSFLSKIPDSPWFMVAKVDKKEIYSSLREQIFLIFVVVLLIILSMVVFTIDYWRNQHVRYLKELNATKDKFFSIVSHDLKSPFVSINGFAGLLVDDVQKKKLSNVEKYAGIILDSSQNAMELLKNLIEWSRIQSNRISINPRDIDVESTIDEVIEQMDAAARQKSIVFNKDVPAGMKIFADKEIISTVLRNLVSNSIKFSHPGGRIYISANQKINEILFEVKDLGVGMKKEIIAKLFRSDQTVSMPGTQREHGSGLGLILVNEFLTLHGGKIWVESEVEKGSRFMFTLPMRWPVK